ncbi:Transmembrane protein 161B [Eumeta japonica]|uniref:Transmembrane protein 161B n=1 Tax=Eumeta variegata TaxID=151549 RepID=A0A4C1WH62_EUMVA|nr:Transmembrane protein 161B [Eumeta japonica]
MKLGNYSFARWLLCSTGLYCYLCPDNNELKLLARVPKEKSKAKKNIKNESNGKPETFHVPRKLDIQLETSPVTALDVVHLRYFTEFQWIVDFSVYASVVYIMSEYFTNEESIGERSTCIVSFCVFLLIAMIVLIIDESNLEVGVDPAYDNFYDNASKFLENQGLSSVGPASKLILKLSIALWAAIVGTVFTFPGLRMGQMYWDSLKMSNEAFDTLRLVAIIIAVLLRVALLPRHLQAYLDMAQRRLDIMNNEAGRITNIDLQKKITSVFYYLCVVALQYICPIVMCLFLTFMYKTLGGYTWTGLFYESQSVSNETITKVNILNVGSESEAEATIKESAQQFQLAFENLKMVFTPEVFKGLFGFGTWWCCFAVFITNSLGLAYQTHFRFS